MPPARDLIALATGVSKYAARLAAKAEIGLDSRSAATLQGHQSEWTLKNPLYPGIVGMPMV